MEWFQHSIAYLILLTAVAYLVHRFIVPIPLFTSSKKKDKSCGGSDCGCH